MGQVPSSESQLQQPLNAAQPTGACLEGQALATQQWESQMRAKQQDLLQQIEDLVKEGKHDPYLVPMSIVRCALAAACSASRQ